MTTWGDTRIDNGRVICAVCGGVWVAGHVCSGLLAGDPTLEQLLPTQNLTDRVVITRLLALEARLTTLEAQARPPQTGDDVDERSDPQLAYWVRQARRFEALVADSQASEARVINERDAAIARAEGTEANARVLAGRVDELNAKLADATARAEAAEMERDEAREAHRLTMGQCWTMGEQRDDMEALKITAECQRDAERERAGRLFKAADSAHADLMIARADDASDPAVYIDSAYDALDAALALPASDTKEDAPCSHVYPGSWGDQPGPTTRCMKCGEAFGPTPTPSEERK